MTGQKHLAIVIPAYNEEKTILSNMQKLAWILDNDNIDYSVILIDDGSADATWAEIAKLRLADPRFGAIRFSRNFGKEAAICAGLRASYGDYYLVMDSDLQHPPQYIKEMIALIESSGADIIDGIKKARGEEGFLYKLCAKMFYRTFDWFASFDLKGSSDFKLMRGNVVEAVNSLGEGNIFFRGVVSWVGFKKEPFPFSVEDRIGDKSRFSKWKLIRFAIEAMLSFTSKPLYITFVIGIFCMVFAVILGIQTLYNFFIGHAESGFSTVILLQLIIGSSVLVSLGLIGTYIARIFNEVKRRPPYIVAEEMKNDRMRDK